MKSLKHLIVFFFYLPVVLLSQGNAPVILKGHVVDRVTQEGICFANIILKDTNGRIIAETSADINGKFSLEPNSPGTFILEVSFQGYKRRIIENYHIADGINYKKINLSQPFTASLFWKEFRNQLERSNPKSSGIITGFYSNGQTWAGGERLYLNNNRFILEGMLSDCFGGYIIKQVQGTYHANKSELVLRPEYFVHVNALDGQAKIDTVQYRSLKTGFQDDSINLRYFIVKWQKYIYLLSDGNFSIWDYRTETNDIENFISYYNSGYEPQTQGLYLRKPLDLEKFSLELDKDQIPDKYRKMLLDSPIEAKIVSVDLIEEEGENKFRIKINKGARDGVTEKMKFHTVKGGCSLLINQVMESVSYGIADRSWSGCKKRKKLSTYLIRELGEPD